MTTAVYTPKPETIEAPWQTLPRGARLRVTPKEVMVDIDEVLMPLIDSIHSLAFERGLHDGSVEPKWRGWEAYGCDEQTYWDLWSDFALADGYLVTEPIPGSVEALRRIYWEGHSIRLVTARGFMENADRIREWTPRWLEEFAVPYHTLTFHNDKVAAQSHLGVRFDHAVDDSPKNFQALLDDGVDAWLLHHPHNSDVETDRRIKSLDEYVDIIFEESK